MPLELAREAFSLADMNGVDNRSMNGRLAYRLI